MSSNKPLQTLERPRTAVRSLTANRWADEIRSGTLASTTAAGWFGAAFGAWHLSHPVSANCGHFGGRRVTFRHASQASCVCNNPRLDYSRGLRF